MSCLQYDLWMEFYNENPFGYFRTDVNTAYICQSLTGGKLTDYIHDWKPKTEEEKQKIAKIKGDAFLEGLSGWNKMLNSK